MDASRAGEGQLEISINDGDVPNAVQVRNSTFSPFLLRFFYKKYFEKVLGGGKCLVTYTPEQAITHEIEVTFNGEQVTGESTQKCTKSAQN